MTNSSDNDATIAVLGAGHVGLPTALGFAEIGRRVIAADSNPATVESLQRGEIPFFEPGLQTLLRRRLDDHSLTVTTDIQEAIRSSSILFICVGTPQRNDGRADLSQLDELARTIACNLNGYKLIVEKSTVPALTGQALAKAIRLYGVGAGAPAGAGGSPTENDGTNGEMLFDIASNPEFLQEGHAVQNVLHPARVVCGVAGERAEQILRQLYAPLAAPMIFTDLNTAEVIKYAANAFLALKISFANMLADVCDRVGGDVSQVALGIGLDPRIGKAFLNAGLGFGGYCLPKDVAAFIQLAQDTHVNASLLEAAKGINDSRIQVFVDKIRQTSWTLQGKTFAVLGLAFKPGTNDIRCAPSLKVVEALRQEHAAVRVFDPQAMAAARELIGRDPGVHFCEDAYEACVGASALLLLTEWEEFRRLDFERIRNLLQVPVIVDGRNFYDPGRMRRHGFEYVCMGRPAAGVSATQDDCTPMPTAVRSSCAGIA